MAGPVETGMTKGEMRKMLTRSTPDKPVGCAIGSGDNPAFSLLLLHKTKRKKALEALLTEDFPKAKNVRFGTAFVNKEENPKLVNVQLNRHAPGIARRLIKTLKGTGIIKVRIVTDEGEVDEFEEADDGPIAADEPDTEEQDTAEEEEPAVAAAPPPPAPPPPPAGPKPEEQAARAKALGSALAELNNAIPAKVGSDEERKAALQKLVREAAVNLKVNNLNTAEERIEQLRSALAAPPAPPPPPPGASPDQQATQSKMLASALAELAGTIPAKAGSDEVRKVALLKLAQEANVNIKTGNLKTAGEMIEKLRSALSEAAATTAGPTDKKKLEQIRIRWQGVRQQVASDVDSLRAALQSAYGAEPFANEVMSRFKAKVDPMLARLDGRLETALSEVESAQEPAQQAAKAVAARAVVKDYLTFATSDPFIADLDSNPFVQLAIRDKATRALTDVARQLI